MTTPTTTADTPQGTLHTNGETPRDTGSNRAFWLIWTTLFIEMLGIGMIIPVMPSLINELTGLQVNKAAAVGGTLTFVYAGVQFFLSPVLGALSDRFGRRPVILGSLGGYAVDFMLMAFAPALWMVFIGRALSGAFAATYATASAAIADITSPDKKAMRYGMLGAAFGMGFILGPLIGGGLFKLEDILGAGEDGVIFGLSGARLPFLAAAILSAINAVIAWRLLPETLKPAKRRAFDIKRANPVGNLWSIRRYPTVLWLLAAFAVFQLAHTSLTATWTYYGEYRYGWDAFTNGAVLAFVGIVFALFQGGLTGRAVKRLGETKAIIIGLTVSVVQYTIFAAAGVGWVVFVGILIGGAGAFFMPATQSRMTTLLSDDAQGELQGAVASIMALTMIIGTVIMTQTFTFFTSQTGALYVPGAAFYLAAALTACALAIALIGLGRNTNDTNNADQPPSEPPTAATPTGTPPNQNEQQADPSA